ncbi:eCIS core domain-containing protein [Streptomyces gelaticus]|uniref:eCIS core domain-containing protein n=1 Tax=Streptomyces gelaticus TaxID=285446 RepID=UPI003570B6C4
MRRPETGELPEHLPLNLQNSLGNAAVVQLLRQAGHPWAQPEEQQHSEEHRHDVQRSAVHGVLRTGGKPMDTALRAEMEARLGADFSDVRIHDDSAARASAAEVGARAYTSGHHVVVGAGGGDKHTLAHELTHVIQQRQGTVAGTDNGAGLRISDPADTYERAAEQNARRVMSSPVRTGVPGDREESASHAPSTTGTSVQRAGDWKNNPTKNALAAEKAANPGNALVHTLHHIVPKSLLERFAGLLTSAQLTDVVTALGPVAPTAFTSNSSQLNAVSKALKNVPANFALGPEPAVRNDDPGSSGPDLNFTEDGAITPRSEQLEHVYDFIEQKVSTGAAVTQAELQNEFIDPMEAACIEHNAVIARLGLANGVGLDPGRTAWSGNAATRSQRRTHMIEPLV